MRVLEKDMVTEETLTEATSDHITFTGFQEFHDLVCFLNDSTVLNFLNQFLVLIIILKNVFI